jgi:hypothetical protein
VKGQVTLCFPNILKLHTIARSLAEYSYHKKVTERYTRNFILEILLLNCSEFL